MKDEVKTIKTGVDRLVNLVRQKKRISVDDAAKALGMPKVLVEEWSDFLEEKEVIGIEYKLSTPYLIYKELTDEEMEEQTKKFAARKEGFVRKVDTILQYLEHESEGLPRLKKEFADMTKEIEAKTGYTKGELKLLQRYDEMKKVTDAKILEQETLFEEKKHNIDQKIEMNRRAVRRYLELIEEKEKELSSEENIANFLKKNEAELKRKLQSIVQEANAYEEKVIHDQKLIDDTVKKLMDLKKISSEAKAEIEQEKRDLLNLTEESKMHEKKVQEIKKRFFDEFSSVTDKTQALKSGELKNTIIKFDKLFSKKLEAEKIVGKLNADLINLKDELRALSNEGMILQMRSKSNKSADYTKDFEAKFAKLNREKEAFHKEVRRLLDTLKN